MTDFIEVRVARRRWAADTVLELELEAADGAPLPACAPGSHIDLPVGDGLLRQYSLVDGAGHSPAPAARYRLGIKVQAAGRGGSHSAASYCTEGRVLRISRPRNLFALQTGTRPVILVAGGIGITPIHAMASHLRATGVAHWNLHYAYMRREYSYFPSDWMDTDARVHHYPSEPAQSAGRSIDLAQLVDQAVAQGGADIYCCGPQGLMDALGVQCAGRPEIRYVTECFEAPDLRPDGSETAFCVTLARSGRQLMVPTTHSILEVLRTAGVDVPYSCEQGICGACETPVLQGIPRHRDAILSPSEQAAGKSMMICCSRASSAGLTLDL
jgi:ferredoxin-NADP reductase